MLYLNDDFNGAPTNFLSENQGLYQDAEGRFVGEAHNVVKSIRPETGAPFCYVLLMIDFGPQIDDVMIC